MVAGCGKQDTQDGSLFISERRTCNARHLFALSTQPCHRKATRWLPLECVTSMYELLVRHTLTSYMYLQLTLGPACPSSSSQTTCHHLHSYVSSHYASSHHLTHSRAPAVSSKTQLSAKPYTCQSAAPRSNSQSQIPLVGLIFPLPPDPSAFLPEVQQA